MGIYDDVFPLGLGTSRLWDNKDICSEEEYIETQAELVLRALELGVNYIDTAPTYANGKAHIILKRAFDRTNKTFRITTKVGVGQKTAKAAISSVENHISSMGLDHVSDFLVWSIYSYEQFKESIQPGGIYDGALELKKRGVIDHISCSIHASTEDTISILSSGMFESALISLSVLNYYSMIPVLDYADKHNISLAVMNPLGGGFIAQNQEYFGFLCNTNESVINASLKFVYSFPAVKLVLSGVSTVRELESNVETFKRGGKEFDRNKIARLSEIKSICTGCKYCEPCPCGVPISSLMQSRNASLFLPTRDYNDSNSMSSTNFQILKSLSWNQRFMPYSSDNPCIKCHKCEKSCTQHLNICESVDKIYGLIKESCYSLEDKRDRLNNLLNNRKYKKVAFWPSSPNNENTDVDYRNHWGFVGMSYANYTISLYKGFFGEPDFKIYHFNSSPKIFGKTIDGIRYYGPNDIKSVNPDCILIVSHKYKDEIYNQLKEYEKQGIKIVKLHNDTDIPWVWSD